MTLSSPNRYGIQLVFMTNRKLDYYDDLLVVSKDVNINNTLTFRKEMVGSFFTPQVDTTSFVALTLYYMDYVSDTRFTDLPCIKQYIDEMDIYFSTCHQENQIKNNLSSDTFLYNQYFLHYPNIQPSLLSLKTLQYEMNEIDNNNPLDIKTRCNLMMQQKIQEIRADPIYEKKIQDFEKQLCSIELTENELKEFQNILHHPRFENDTIYYTWQLILVPETIF